MRYLFFLVKLVTATQLHANTPPVLRNDSLSICKNASTDSFNLFANDFDAEGDSLFISDTLIKPNHGTYAFNGGKLIYTPDAGYRGSDKLYLKICDNGTPSLCSYSFVVIAIDTCYPFNHAPVAGFDSLGACRNQLNELLVLNNDADSDGDSIYIYGVSNPPQNGNDSIGNGHLFYRPNTGFTGTDNLSYVICDVPSSLLTKCDTQRIKITVINCGGTNNAPTAQVDIVPGVEDAFIQLPFDPRDNDTDPDGDSLTWNAVFGPLNGTVSKQGQRWIYKPNANYNGIDVMPYRVCDNRVPQKCAYSVVTFITTAVNDAPQIRADTFNVPEDETDTLRVTANDVDVDGDFITVNFYSLPSHGSASVVNRNRVQYIPNPNFNGDDEFIYEGCDSFKCLKARVLIHVLPVNDAPVAYPDSAGISDDAIAYVPVTINDVDIDGDSLLVTAADSTACYTSTVLDGNKLLIVFNTNGLENCGGDTLHYTVCDQSGACSSTFIIVNGSRFHRDSTITLPQGFSPDNDGVNDKLVFLNLEAFYPATLKVFNRYGLTVYSNDEYQNDWNGKDSDHNLDLPDGPYWYVLELANGKRFVNFCELRR